MLLNALKQAASSLVRRERSDLPSLSSLLSRARVSLASGNQQEAEQRYREILGLWPNSVEAHHQIGRMQGVRGQWVAAREHLLKAVELEPDLAEAWADLGNVHKFDGRSDEAIACYRKSLHLETAQPATWFNLGLCLREQEFDEEAANCFHQALEISLEFAPALRNWVAVQNKLQRYDETRAVLQEILRDHPNYPEAHAALGYLLVKRYYQPDVALVHFQTAKELGLADAELMGNRGIALQDVGSIEEAIESYSRALELEPENHSFRFHRGLAYLLKGDFSRGWPDYEYRLRSEEQPKREFPMPRWRGESLQGRNILIYAEQGLGDEIMFASCLPDIIAQAEHCVIDCHPKLEAIFRRSFPQATVHGGSQFAPTDWIADHPTIDLCLPIGSLPLYLRRNLGNFPRHSGYLKADKGRVDFWSTRLASLGKGKKIGISWRGGTSLTRRPLRSIGLEQLLPLLSRQGLHFVSLQYDADESEIGAFNQANGHLVHHWSEALADYDETAALASSLDMVISVCTSIIHLGGALGKPVWVMAPKVPEWRYGISGEGMAWYPGNRVFRQSIAGDWDSVTQSLFLSLIC